MLRWLRLVALAQLRCGGVHQGSARLWRGTARNAWHDRDKLHSRRRPHNDAAGALLRRVQRHRRACIAPASNKTAPFGVVFASGQPVQYGHHPAYFSILRIILSAFGTSSTPEPQSSPEQQRATVPQLPQCSPRCLRRTARKRTSSLLYRHFCSKGAAHVLRRCFHKPIRGR